MSKIHINNPPIAEFQHPPILNFALSLLDKFIDFSPFDSQPFHFPRTDFDFFLHAVDPLVQVL